MNINITTFLEQGLEEQNKAWHDWFCQTKSLPGKTKKLVSKLKQIVKSGKVNFETSYVFFKNNCPMAGSLYDDFRICDMQSGDVIFTVTPDNGQTYPEGPSEVWGKINDFKEPLVIGTWNDVLAFFGVGDPESVVVERIKKNYAVKKEKLERKILRNRKSELEKEILELKAKILSCENEINQIKTKL